ncbi:MAG TPA: hypothetical protein VMG08_17605 [Allosphingosinicella sp.]|nr:hypothetical protein [Allosphingosinicella sp.]
MRALATLAALTALLSLAGVEPPVAQAQAQRLDLGAALRIADSAEVYVLSGDLAFVRSPDPGTVRSLGCRYSVSRTMPAWRDLQAAVGNVALRPAARPRHGELRVGLVLSDRRGILFEAYGSVPAGAEPMVRGLSQRRDVEIAATFAAAVTGFGARHPELATALVHPARLCPAGSGPRPAG